MRLAFVVSVLMAVAPCAVAQTYSAAGRPLAEAVSELTTGACYNVESRSIATPSGDGPDLLDQSFKMIEQMGLKFGASPSAMKGLGTPGIVLVSQAIMGSKAVEGGDVVIAIGGRQPGCRVILLSDTAMEESQVVATRLTQKGWKEAPSSGGLRAGISRRMFVKRDAKGAPYLVNLMTVVSPLPGSTMRLFTTTSAIPANVQLPPGF